jgi:hypothetical protein
MPQVAFALTVGFTVGLLVGYLIRNESRQYEADLGGHEGAEH